MGPQRPSSSSWPGPRGRIALSPRPVRPVAVSSTRRGRSRTGSRVPGNSTSRCPDAPAPLLTAPARRTGLRLAARKGPSPPASPTTSDGPFRACPNNKHRLEATSCCASPTCEPRSGLTVPGSAAPLGRCPPRAAELVCLNLLTLTPPSEQWTWLCSGGLDLSRTCVLSNQKQSVGARPCFCHLQGDPPDDVVECVFTGEMKVSRPARPRTIHHTC